MPDASDFAWSRAGTVDRQRRAALLHQDQTTKVPKVFPELALVAARRRLQQELILRARGMPRSTARLSRPPPEVPQSRGCLACRPGGRGRSAQRRRPASACGEAGRCQLLRSMSSRATSSWSCPATWRCSSAHSDSSPASRSALTSANAAAAYRGKNAPRACLAHSIGVQQDPIAKRQGQPQRLRVRAQAQRRRWLGWVQLGGPAGVDQQRRGMPAVEHDGAAVAQDLDRHRGHESSGPIARVTLRSNAAATWVRSGRSWAASRKLPSTTPASRTASRPLPRTSPTSSRTPCGVSSAS